MSEGKDSGRKRVRFSDTPEVREFTTAAQPPPSKRRAADPMEALEGERCARPATRHRSGLLPLLLHSCLRRPATCQYKS